MDRPRHLWKLSKQSVSNFINSEAIRIVRFSPRTRFTTTDHVEVELRWSGGFVSHHRLQRPVQTYEQLSNYDELMSRIKSLRADGHTLREVAKQLNEEGFRPPKRSPQFNVGILSGLLRNHGIRTGPLPRSVTEENHLFQDEWWLSDLAARLGMPIATMHRWRIVGWVSSRKVIAAAGRWAIYADSVELDRLTRLRETPRSWPIPYSAELTTPKSRNAETSPRVKT